MNSPLRWVGWFGVMGCFGLVACEKETPSSQKTPQQPPAATTISTFLVEASKTDDLLRTGQIPRYAQRFVQERRDGLVRSIEAGRAKDMETFQQMAIWATNTPNAKTCFERTAQLWAVVRALPQEAQIQASHWTLSAFEYCSTRADNNAKIKTDAVLALTHVQDHPKHLVLRQHTPLTRHIDAVLQHMDRGQGAPAVLHEQDAVYNAQTIALMTCLMTKDAITADVGAFKGDITAKLLKRAPKGTHHAFEPLPYMIAGLKRRFAQKSVVIHPVALGKVSGHATFTHVVSNAGYSGLKSRAYDRQEKTETIKVRVKTLDDVFANAKRLDFIKVDVEGAEYDVLSGGKKIIKQLKPSLVFEFQVKSASAYKVTPQMMYAMLTKELGLQINTMKGLLNGEPSLALEAFVTQASNGKTYYFVATPKGSKTSCAMP